MKVVIILFVILLGLIILKKILIQGIPIAQAKHYLKQGAIVVDVRTQAECQRKALRGTVNVPLDTLPDGLTKKVKDNKQVILY